MVLIHVTYMDKKHKLQLSLLFTTSKTRA